MDKLSKILRVLLKRVPYQIFLMQENSCMNLDRKMIGKAIHSYYSFYSETEMENMLDSLADFLSDYNEFLNYDRLGNVKDISVYDAIFRFSDVMLVEKNNEIMVHYENILRWRQTTQDIHEEIFVTAFLARQDLRNGTYCKDFTWPFVISHSNIQLRKITEKGLAENHFHLWGSAPYFQLSWLWIMNHMTDMERGRKTEKIEENLRTGYLVYEKKYPEQNMKCWCLQAALIRLYLYTTIVKKPIELGTYYIEWEKMLPWLSEVREEVDCKRFRQIIEGPAKSCAAVLEEMEVRYLQPYKIPLRRILNEPVDFSDFKLTDDKIKVRDILIFALKKKKKIELRRCKPFLNQKDYWCIWRKITHQKVMLFLNDYETMLWHVDEIQNAIDSLGVEYGEEILDYILASTKLQGYFENPLNHILSGERWFMYEMFRKIDSRDKKLGLEIYNLFYVYLILKEKIRGELVQSNRWVGFENFSVYQSRNGYFSSQPALDRLKAKMAVDFCLEQHVQSLELRITPENTAMEIYKQIAFLDTEIAPIAGEKYYYVMHFVKKRDEELKNRDNCGCRHWKLRKEVKQKTLALMQFRRAFPNHALRMRGIDAASQEIGCRPEVFAQGFRALQKDTCIVYLDKGFVKLPQLRTTYHVGEDFLDVTDGLRAIDEAVLFLNLECGDRIGHGIVLGICVEEWYNFKRNHISISKQDYLDNIVWLYHAIIRYRIYCLDNLKNHLETEFYKYFGEIYGQYMDRNYIKEILNQQDKAGNIVFDIYAYYDAWKLRGDKPELYRKGFYENLDGYGTSFDDSAVNRKFPANFDVRKNPEAAMLYHFYHYNPDVRIEGSKKIEKKVSFEYVKGVALVQKAMQKEIASRGIAIETNPSSNFMIGTFNRYEEHPIIQFYNNGLTFDEEKLRASPQIWVSINTDDQGVFNIRLENEYALLARALERKKNADGELVYTKSMIYEWLDKIRKMGMDQSFLSVKNEKDSFEMDEDAFFLEKL